MAIFDRHRVSELRARSVVFILLGDAIVTFICRLVQVDLDPAAGIVLLDLNRQLLKPLKLFESADPLLESFLLPVVEDAGADSLENIVELLEEDEHDDEHDEIEECELEDDEQAVSDEEEKDEAEGGQENFLAQARLLDLRMILRVQ